MKPYTTNSRRLRAMADKRYWAQFLSKPVGQPGQAQAHEPAPIKLEREVELAELEAKRRAFQRVAEAQAMAAYQSVEIKLQRVERQLTLFGEDSVQ